MAEHLREQILEAVKSRLTGLADVGAHVYRFRIYPEEATALPSINIVQGDDSPTADTVTDATYTYIYRVLDIGVEIRVKATQDIDTYLNRISRDVSYELKSDITLGMTAVQNVEEGPTSEPEASTEGDQPVAMMMMAWGVHYRTLRTDPSLSST